MPDQGKPNDRREHGRQQKNGGPDYFNGSKHATGHNNLADQPARESGEASMAGRPMGRLHQDDVRAKIQTSQLINRLTSHALGEVELSPTQVRAIEILIKKTLPDLQSIEWTGDPDNPVELVTNIRLVDGNG